MLSNTAIPKEYAMFRQSVLDGEIPVCREISMQMNRIDTKIENPNYYYDDQAINGFIEYCEKECTLTDGRPLILLPSFRLWAEDLLAWYEFIDARVYNPVKRRYEIVTKKLRLTNKQYLVVGRGAAKSVYASLIQSYFLNIDTTTTQQIVTAPTMKQADETMQPIRTAIARARGPLFQFLTDGSVKSRNWSKKKLASTKKGIENSLTNSIIEVRPMRIDKLQGARSKINTIDEWLSGATKEDVIGAIEQGASKIDDYAIVATSSEGTIRDSVGDTIKMELLDILRGDYDDPHTSIFYYRLDDVKEVGQPEMWAKANPNLGVTVSYETYQRDVERAEAQPANRNDILAKRFGIPVEGYTYFFTYEETLLYNPQSFDGQECSLGMDASQGDDFWAFTFIFPLSGEMYGVKTRSYVCQSKVDKLPGATKSKYMQFVKEGSLVISDKPYLDPMMVFDDLDNYIMSHDYIVLSFGFDPYNAKEFVERWSRENGELGVTKVIQGAKTESVPLGQLKTLASERRLVFDEELMKYAMGNAIAIQDNNNNYKLSKRRSDEKIDNVAALLDSWVAYNRNQEAFM